MTETLGVAEGREMPLPPDASRHWVRACRTLFMRGVQRLEGVSTALSAGKREASAPSREELPSMVSGVAG